VIRAMVEDGIDAMKISSQDIEAVLVGGGSVLLPKNLLGTSTVYNPEYSGCANAIGSAISKVSGTYEQLVDYNVTPRETALEQAKAKAAQLAVEAGAIEDTVEIIESEDVPLAYYPGNTSRVKVKAAGDLR
jgi:N-methylhydantoinase A/oxoprolinase/acetone carboxylase beta subunit